VSFIIAAPASGSGKTTVTLGILRAFKNSGTPHRAAKSGPDYIDPRFHAHASGQDCFNLDAWAMTPERIQGLSAGALPLIIEGAMGLFDGAPPDGRGATADLAKILKLPVVLVVDASRQAQSIAALLHGFATYDPKIEIAGVILNKVGSARHEKILRRALQHYPVLGAIPRHASLQVPSRHLGLVQAMEHPDLEAYLTQAAHLITAHVDLDALSGLSVTAPTPPSGSQQRLTPPAQSIAIAQDASFAFAYPHLLNDWQDAGATLQLFSPLNDDPVPKADLIYLPGGYPELYAAQISTNSCFLDSLSSAAEGTDIYGECGGYMVLGEHLIDADGNRHQMAGLLDLETSFATRKLHLGYRHVQATHGPFAGNWAAHEFHYATTLRATGETLFQAQDAEGTQLPAMGLRKGRVSGSFAHIIDRAQ
jgi:cobyrinic acid a,c-diamide synthase